MMTHMSNRHYGNRWKQMRSAFVLFAALLIATGAIVWILNIEHIIKGPWSSIIGVIFTFLGVVIALLQWHSQHPATVNTAPSAQRPGPQRSHKLMESSCAQASEHAGVLIVYTKKSLRGATVNLNHGFDNVNLKTHVASNVVEREEHGHRIYTSIFPSLEPGNYTAYINAGQLVAQVTILAGQVAEIDWR